MAWTQTLPKTTEAEGTSLVSFNGKLYMGTAYNAHLYEWNGVAASWSQVATGAAFSYIKSLIVYNGKLYAAISGSGQGVLSEWTGAAWSIVASTLLGENILNKLLVYNNKIYVCTDAGYLFEWDGVSAWVNVSSPLNAKSVRGITEYNGKIYGGAEGALLYEWDGVSAWVGVAGQYSNHDNVWDVREYGGELYGVTNQSGITGHLIKWDDVSAWVFVADATMQQWRLQIVDTDLYLSGTTGMVRKWDGATLTNVTNFQAEINNIYALEQYIGGDYRLYAVGVSGTEVTGLFWTGVQGAVPAPESPQVYREKKFSEGDILLTM